MSYAYVFWTKHLGEIIPIRDLKLNDEQKKISDEIGGLDHVVGQIVKARYGEEFYEAEVFKIGSAKELSEAEDYLFAAEKELKSEEPPKHYGHSQDSSGSEEKQEQSRIKILLDKNFFAETREDENIRNELEVPGNNQLSSDQQSYEEALGTCEVSPCKKLLVEENGSLTEVSNNTQIAISLNKESCALQDKSLLSHAELVDEVIKLRKIVSSLEAQQTECPKCIRQRPPPIVRQYFKSLLGEESEKDYFLEPQKSTSHPTTNKVPLIEGCDLVVTKAQKVNIIVEGRNKPKIMISKFLRAFYTLEELGSMSYNGRSNNPPLPTAQKECLNGLLLKYHPKFVGVASAVNRICANARCRWRIISGQTRPGKTSKFTPKTKRRRK